ncbi:MAG TPA: acylphosphatase [Gemmatimonadaceae bacterium]|jgi:acylphosphatase|nr:acylphosphatase [Gemmatimonadaceae bacterium]
MESIHLEIRGRVQGVGFRWFVVEMAKELRLAGWVRNKADGNVELAAAGESEALARLEAAVSAGPSGARVEEVRRLGVVPADSLQSPFGIVR